MKKILLATTVLVGTAGFAAAEVTLSGDGRMGVVSHDDVVSFSSRARVKFNLAGTTDNGLEFGGSFRANNANTDSYVCGDADEDGYVETGDCSTVAGGADNGLAGSVFISGGFGTITMGDIDSAANSAVGQIAGVGYTGLGTLNEISYLTSGSDTGAAYEYTAGQITGYASIGTDAEESRSSSLGVKYTTDAVTLGAGIDHTVDANQYAVSASTVVSGVTLTGLYSATNSLLDGVDPEYATGASASYTIGATTLTAFALGNGSGADAEGIGASHDLGGGAALSAGLVHTSSRSNDISKRTVQSDDILADLGVTFSF